MARKKSMKERGKFKISEYFKILKKGDKVAMKREQSLAAYFPKRVQGRTGEVVEKKGSNYVVKLKEFNKEKKFIVHPIHLKRIKMQEKK